MTFVLCVDGGSSSLKIAFYEVAKDERLLFEATLPAETPASHILAVAHERNFEPEAVSHRIVFGGANEQPRFAEPSILAELQRYEAIDPTHLPAQLRLVHDLREQRPDLPNVLCFDTAFHDALPKLAKMLPLAQSANGLLRRYGFHGLSYEYACSQIEWRKHPRALIAHLGNGASMTAVRDGKPVETTMGFSPCGGLMMGTRSGDLDPGVLFYLQRERGMTLQQVDDLCNRASGLLGVSGKTSDMRALLAQRDSDAACATAVDLFVHIAVKHAGALVAAMGGLDLVAFTGGIGENAPAIRAAIVSRMEFLQPFDVTVVPARETLMLARHAHQLLAHEYSKSAR